MRIGQLVILASGGPLMTVVAINGDEITAEWVTKWLRQKQQHTFLRVTLRNPATGGMV